MKQYKGKAPDRDHGRYADWVDKNYDTNYWRFRRIWFPRNKFNIWDITYGSDAYEKQDARSTVRRWDPWEGESASLTFTTYFHEIRKACGRKKIKGINCVYKPYGRG